MERYKYKIILKVQIFWEILFITHLYSKQLCTENQTFINCLTRLTLISFLIHLAPMNSDKTWVFDQSERAKCPIYNYI